VFAKILNVLFVGLTPERPQERRPPLPFQKPKVDHPASGNLRASNGLVVSLGNSGKLSVRANGVPGEDPWRSRPESGFGVPLMKNSQIAEFALSHLEAVAMPERYGGSYYRCAAFLTDGLYLPCVVLKESETQVNLAIGRFRETLDDEKESPARRRFGPGMQYRDIVRSFVTSSNRVNQHDIHSLEHSRFAIPLDVLKQVHGETSMGWTQFVGVMRDGKEFSFGTTYHVDFFQMPRGYTGNDIVSVRSHERLPGEIYRERPFFACYVEGLSFPGA
jgi:hypothetical protein